MTLRQRAIATLRAAGFARNEISLALGVSGSTYDREIKAMRQAADRLAANAESAKLAAARLAAAAEE